MLRICGGKDRGRVLKSLKGDLTRPTSGRVREALFSVLGERIEGARFLEPFGGSGAVSLEAVSRGAAQATIIEQARGAYQVIAENVKLLGYERVVRLLSGDALRILERLEGPFDIAFIDPPYGKGLGIKSLELMIKRGLMKEDGRIFFEHRADEPVPEAVESWERLKTYRYSDTTVSLYGKG